MEQQYRATVFLKFSMKPEKMKELGFDIEMPPSGFLYDDLLALLNGEEGVTVVESAVVKECTPLPTPMEVVQTILGFLLSYRVSAYILSVRIRGLSSGPFINGAIHILFTSSFPASFLNGCHLQ